MSYIETPGVTATIPRELAPVIEYLQYVPHGTPTTAYNETRRVMIAYTIMLAVAHARERIVLDSDLKTLVPKHLRDEAMVRAVEHGLLRRTEWRGKPAWQSV
jgi:alkylhydroperoxidase family enzyme